MAVYEFECQACNKRFEVTVPISEHGRLKEKPPACPSCKKKKSRQLVSMFNCPSPKAY